MHVSALDRAIYGIKCLVHLPVKPMEPAGDQYLSTTLCSLWLITVLQPNSWEVLNYQREI